MPYDNSFDPNDDEENQTGQTGQQPASQQSGATSLAPSTGLVNGDGTSQGAGKGGSSPAPTQPQGSFTDLNSYLDANQGFGTQLANKVQGTVDQANQDTTEADQAFQGDVNQNNISYNPDLVNSDLANATTTASDPSKVAAFQSQLNATYNGPQSFADDSTDYDPAYQASQNAVQAGNASTTEGGRFALLNQYFEAPNYTQGQQNLDQFLAEDDPTAGTAWQNVQNNAKAAGTNFQNVTNSDDAYAQAANTNTQNTSAQTMAALGLNPDGTPATAGAYGDFTTGLNNSVTGDTATQTADYNKLLAELTPQSSGPNESLTQAVQHQNLMSTLEKYDPTTAGFDTGDGSGSTGNYLFDVDPSQYVTKEAAPTQSSEMTADRVAQLNALNTLAGNQILNIAPATTLYNPATDVGFDSANFNKARIVPQNTAQTDYNTDIVGKQAGDSESNNIDQLEYNNPSAGGSFWDNLFTTVGVDQGKPTPWINTAFGGAVPAENAALTKDEAAILQKYGIPAK